MDKTTLELNLGSKSDGSEASVSLSHDGKLTWNNQKLTVLLKNERAILAFEPDTEYSQKWLKSGLNSPHYVKINRIKLVQLQFIQVAVTQPTISVQQT